MVTLIKDIFMFFARFPQKSGVMEMFTNGRSDMPEYAQWMQEVNDLPDEPLLGEIKHFVLGVDPKNVLSRMNTFSDCFLFIDYGQIENEIDRVNNRRESWVVAITIAFPGRDSNNDLVERAIKSDRALDLLCRLRHTLIQEEKCIPWLKNFQADHIITPWVADDIAASYGWTVIIRRQGFDMLQGK